MDTLETTVAHALLRAASSLTRRRLVGQALSPARDPLSSGSSRLKAGK
jgi:hypothetical protein